MNIPRPPPSVASPNGHAILVVDDSQDNLDLMVEVLEDGPWRVTTARDAEIALKLASEAVFDLLILDVHMPDVDGFELCRRLRREPDIRNVPIIFLTAERTSRASVIEGLDRGGYDYIVKPFDRAELLARVRVMLHLREAENGYLTVQRALVEQNESLSAISDRLAETYQQMLDHRTQLMRKSEELRRANRIKSEFLAKMSHELRTPMNSIIGFTDLLSSDEYEPPTERQAKRLEKVGRNGRLLLALINDILDLSKIEAGRLTLDFVPVKLSMVLTECVELAMPLIGDKPVAFESRIPSTLLTWEGDEIRLRQVVMNLLSNAAKFTERGTITLEVSEGNESVSIAVRDTGVGIAPEHLPYVFDTFRQVDSSSTRRAGGTGLGLAICKSLCDLMGGEIEARSNLGGGSTFAVRLPRRARQCAVDHDSPRELATPQSAGLILVCTDNIGMVDLASTHLSRHGIEVRHIDVGDVSPGLIQEGRPVGALIDIRCGAAATMLRLAAELSPPLLWLTAWTEDHQLGCCLELDGLICDMRDRTAVLDAVSGFRLGNQVALIVAGSEDIRAEFRDVLVGVGFRDIRTASDSQGAIGELTSGSIATMIIHLGEQNCDAFELIERARGVAEWAPIHIVGVIPRAGEGDMTGVVDGPPEEFLRKRGESTPTLLLDIAEQVMAESPVETVGAQQ